MGMNNAAESSICVGVSLEGFQRLFFTVPSSVIVTMSSSHMPSYGTPDGLMMTSPDVRSMPDTLRHVNVTSPYFGSRRLASQRNFLMYLP